MDIYSHIGYICCCLKKYEESLEANLKAYELGENNKIGRAHV